MNRPCPQGLTLLIVDDHLAVRSGLQRLVGSAPLALQTVHLAGTHGEALAAALEAPPDLVILDVDLAGDDGLTLLPHLVPGARVLVLTSHGDATTRARALGLGASAFVDKQAPAAELVAQLCRLATGEAA